MSTKRTPLDNACDITPFSVFRGSIGLILACGVTVIGVYDGVNLLPYGAMAIGASLIAAVQMMWTGNGAYGYAAFFVAVCSMGAGKLIGLPH